MLYIFQLTILIIWFIAIIKKFRYSSHAILNSYFFFVTFVDIAEGTFSYIFEFYKFNTHLVENIKSNAFGLLIGDGYILPITGIIVLHYATRFKNLWLVSFIFAAVHGMLEIIYTKLGYLTYIKWSTWISFGIYLFSSRLITGYASGFMLYSPPIPYFVRIAAATYSITIYIGAFISGGLFNFYQWRPLIARNPGDDDRVVSIGISMALSLLSALIIPKIKPGLRPLVFVVFAMLAIAFSYYAYGQGWLIYHKWNHLLTALYWIVSILALAWYDRWEQKFEK